MIQSCKHKKVTCLNQYEYIRKYICEDCKEVMMCSCDEEFGHLFLPHQLNKGTWLNSQKMVSVTIGFQTRICLECRGEREIPAPVSSMRGRTTKILRYYWREIYFETTRRFYNAHPELNPQKTIINSDKYSKSRKEINKQVIEEIKQLHEKNPKYNYSELSQKEIIDSTKTEVILINAKYIKNEEKRLVRIQSNYKILSVEEFASEYFEKKGYKILITESAPFQVLFGIFMFLVIQNPTDTKRRVVSFGSRFDSDSGFKQEGLITTILPEDFGTTNYFFRQNTLIKRHLQELGDLDWTFDYWLDGSYQLRQYLWAHRDEDIKKAKQIMHILGLKKLRKVLNYMVMNYWRNYCGWPDLLVYNKKEFFFVEVKSSNDKLSEDQKNWFLGNHKHMGFLAKIFKVGISRTV